MPAMALRKPPSRVDAQEAEADLGQHHDRVVPGGDGRLVVRPDGGSSGSSPVPVDAEPRSGDWSKSRSRTPDRIQRMKVCAAHRQGTGRHAPPLRSIPMPPGKRCGRAAQGGCLGPAPSPARIGQLPQPAPCSSFRPASLLRRSSCKDRHGDPAMAGPGREAPPKRKKAPAVRPERVCNGLTSHGQAGSRRPARTSRAVPSGTRPPFRPSGSCGRGPAPHTGRR